MTLVITRLGDAGIAMLADSMIAYAHPVTGVLDSRRDYQQKLFKMPRVTAGVSYWGMIGHVIKTTPFTSFAEWLRAHISVSNPASLKQFAADLADSLNRAYNQKPFPKDASMGVHVAGYQQWGDRVIRPAFYHVHNGHLHSEWTSPETPNVVSRDPTGRCILIADVAADDDEARRREMLAGKIQSKAKMEPRGLFEAHLDFPKEENTLAENEAALARGYVTANGDYFRYSVQAQREELSELRTADLPKVEVSQHANRSTGDLLQTIHTQAKSLIGEVIFEKPPPTFGGRLWTLGINANGYVGCDERL